jgi:hypothetical protein
MPSVTAADTLFAALEADSGKSSHTPPPVVLQPGDDMPWMSSRAPKKLFAKEGNEDATRCWPLYACCVCVGPNDASTAVLPPAAVIPIPEAMRSIAPCPWMPAPRLWTLNPKP